MTTQEEDDFRRLLADLMTVKAARDQAEAERDALAAAMPSEGADAALAYAVEHSRANRAEATLAAIRTWTHDYLWHVRPSAVDALLALLDAALKETP